MYTDRAHAVLPKSSFAKQAVRESVALVWAARFGLPELDDDAQGGTDQAIRVIEKDLVECTRQLISQIDVSNPAEWPRAKKKLHQLKGEILSLPLALHVHVEGLTATINELRAHEQAPDDVEQQWHELRSKINFVLTLPNDSPLSLPRHPPAHSSASAAWAAPSDVEPGAAAEPADAAS
jgi:hypothetical protein